MWAVPFTCVWKCKSGLIVLGFVVAIISLSSSTSSRVTGLQWEEHKSRVAIDNESVIIEALTEEELQSLQSSRHKRQFSFGTGFPSFQGFPQGWPFLPQGGNFPGFPQGFPNPTITTPRPTMPSQIGSCFTRNGVQGRCATLRQCYPVLYNSIDGEGPPEEDIRNPGLAAELREAAGPCDTHTMPNFLVFRADVEFRQNLICCGSGDGSNKNPPAQPKPPSVSDLFHPQITMRPPWAHTTTTKPTTTIVPTHRTTTTTTTAPQNHWPNWPPPIPTHAPTASTAYPHWQHSSMKPPSVVTTPTPAVQPPVSSSCGFSKIVGGTQAQKSEFPWLIALMRNGKQFCGGSLIDSQWILTAAHCVEQFTAYDVSSIRAQIGDYDIYSNTDGPVTIRGISKLVRHKGFDKRTLHNDIALLKLDFPVQFGTNNNNNIQPICLAQSGGYEGATATVAGWGGIYEHGPQPAIYRKVDLSVWQNQQCAAKYGQYAPGGITSHMVCAGSTTKDACRGDSGGPLMRNSGGRWEQIGIVSWGIGCGKYPGVFSRVDHFKNWIANNRVH